MSSLSLLNSSKVMPFLTLTAVFLFIGPVLFTEINTKITNKLSARLSEVNSSFTAELGKNNNKLTAEIKNFKAHDAGYIIEAQKILGRLNNIEEACHNDFGRIRSLEESV